MNKLSKRFIALSSILLFSLVGCSSTTKLEPKEAYMQSIEKLENASSYEKTSQIDFELHLTNNDDIMYEILEHGDFETVGKKDENNSKTEMTLSVTSNLEHLPLDFELTMLVDEKKEKTYIDGSDFFEALSHFTPVSVDAKDKMIEIDYGKNENTSQEESKNNEILTFLKSDVSKLAHDVEPSKFERLEVASDEKEKGVRDKIQVSFSSQEASLDEITLTFYLNRKGELIYEDVKATLVTNNQEVPKIEMTSSSHYDKFNEELSFELQPNEKETVSINEIFSTK